MKRHYRLLTKLHGTVLDFVELLVFQSGLCFRTNCKSSVLFLEEETRTVQVQGFHRGTEGYDEAIYIHPGGIVVQSGVLNQCATKGGLHSDYVNCTSIPNFLNSIRRVVLFMIRAISC
jgi:hypothetical protein